MLKLRILWLACTVSAVLAMETNAQTPRILVVGDSWAAISAGNGNWNNILNTFGHSDKSIVNSGVGGLPADSLNNVSFNDLIQNPLLANPSVDWVHISTGGIDMLGGWTAGIAGTGAEQNLFNAIIDDIQSIINKTLAIRPDIQITLASYDYLNLWDTVIADPFGAPGLTWNALGQPTPAQINNAFLGVEQLKANLANTNSRVQYSNIFGFMQILDGYSPLFPPPPGCEFGLLPGQTSPNCPTPTTKLAGGGTDPIHLDDDGYNVYVQHAFTNMNATSVGGFDQGIYGTSTILGTNPGSGGTLGFGNVLVGQTGSQTLTVTNNGVVGSRLQATFPSPVGEFSRQGSADSGHLFVDQNLGFGTGHVVPNVSPVGDNTGRTYGYSPTARGADAQGVTVTSNRGSSNVTLSGQGVAPVNDVNGNSIGFGKVRIGTSANGQTTVTNIGDGNLSGSGATSNLNGSLDPGTGEFSGAGGAVSLADGANQAFNYLYSPTDHGLDASSIDAAFTNGSDDGTNSAQTVPISLDGTGIGPVFDSSALPGSMLNLGDIFFGGDGAFLLDLENISIDDDGGLAALTNLTLLDITIGGADAGLFSLIGFTPGAVLQQGEMLNLTFQGTISGTGASGLRQATLLVETDEDAPLGLGGNSFSFDLKFNAVRLTADISGDGTVDIGDFTLWGDAFGATGAGLVEDISGDGIVDIGDFTLWGDNFGSSISAPAASGGSVAVPEPATISLFTIGLAGLLAFRWRHRKRHNFSRMVEDCRERPLWRSEASERNANTRGTQTARRDGA